MTSAGSRPGAPSLPGQLALARAATDRQSERRGDDEWLAATWESPSTRVLLVGDGSTLAVGDGLLLLAPDQVPDGERYLLGIDDAGAYFALRTLGPPQPPAGSDARVAGLRALGPVLDDRDAGLLVLAVGLANWHATHGHCPRCGAPTVVRQAGFVRVCTADESEHYPRTDPAVIVLVTDASGDRALLGSSARWGDGIRYSTLAGFVEPGESAEAAVVREVAEESGVAVTEVTYLGSQPWPFPSSLMLGFTARAVDGAAVPVADGVELVDVRWFGRDELTNRAADGTLVLPSAVSIARRLLESWYGGPLADSAVAW